MENKSKNDDRSRMQTKNRSNEWHFLKFLVKFCNKKTRKNFFFFKRHSNNRFQLFVMSGILKSWHKNARKKENRKKYVCMQSLNLSNTKNILKRRTTRTTEEKRRRKKEENIYTKDHCQAKMKTLAHSTKKHRHIYIHHIE